MKGEQQMKRKKLVALFLAASMLLVGAGCGAKDASSDPTTGGTDTQESTADTTAASTETEDTDLTSTCPDYVNLDSTLPFVKEDSGEDITLTMWVASLDNGSKEVEKTWQWVYLQDEGNITLDITLVPWSTKEEKKNLALATGEIPDIMYNMQLTPSDLVTYGANEHILTDLNPLIDAYAPNIKAALEMYPEQRSGWTTPDGGIYSLSQIGRGNSTGGYKIFVSQNWLDEAGITELPTTLDEFTDMLRAFKALHPDDENYVPLGGYSGADYPLAIILQALGFDINSFRSERIYDYALVNNDHVSVISTDTLYGEFLKVARTWYEEGLISQDFFTMDAQASRAQAGEERCGVYVQFGMTTMNSFVKDQDKLEEYLDSWVVLSPLTSEFNDTPMTLKTDGVSVGNFVISESCENKEVAIRLADWFFTSEGNSRAANGPCATEGVSNYGCYDGEGGWYLKEDENGKVVEVFPAAQSDIMSAYKCLGFENMYSIIPDTGKCTYEYRYELAGYPGAYTPDGTFDETTPAGRMNVRAAAALNPYGVTGAPSVLYMDLETSARVSDLLAVVRNYAVSETARFVTGSRSIDEVDDYLREIGAAGGEELNEIYNDLYQSYIAN